MRRLLLLAFLGALLAGAQIPKASVVVVELFTSEGCSSCPAADALLEQLESPPPSRSKQRAVSPLNVQVIALGEHVDYWDDLGWKDRFSSPLFSARQQDYGVAFNDTSVYTPQAVVQGTKAVLGSDRSALNRAIRDAALLPAADVEIRPGADRDVMLLRVGKLPAGSHMADVLLAVAESGIPSFVNAGENKGRHLRHAAVVRSMSRLGALDPSHPGEYRAEARVNLRPEWNRANLKVVLLVQDRQNRRILGAAAAKF